MAAPVRSGWIAQPQQMRVIVDNDFAGDPDGLVALAHAVAPGARLACAAAGGL